MYLKCMQIPASVSYFDQPEYPEYLDKFHGPSLGVTLARMMGAVHSNKGVQWNLVNIEPIGPAGERWYSIVRDPEANQYYVNYHCRLPSGNTVNWRVWSRQGMTSMDPKLMGTAIVNHWYQVKYEGKDLEAQPIVTWSPQDHYGQF